MSKLLQKLSDARQEGWGEWIRSEADEQAVLAGYRFDIHAAERVRKFLRQFIRHSKGEWAGKPFELLEWQWLDVIAPLFGWKRPDGTRRYRRGYVEVPKKNGKALALDTPLPTPSTPSGWTTMGDIKVGDKLYDENSRECNVVAATPVMENHLCYKVELSDETSLIADADHQWVTTTYHPDPVTAVWTTQELAINQSWTVEPGEFRIHWVPEVTCGGQYRIPPREIVKVEPVNQVPVRCVQVDSPSRLYLAGEGLIPTHNSTIFAGLSLYLLVADKEPGAEIYSAAVDRDQASIVYNEAANMVQASPTLSTRLQTIRSTKRIVCHRTRSLYRALSADVPAKEGLNAHGILLDELHAQKSRDLWDTLRYAGASRRQPLHLSITTAGFDRHSICWEQHDYALRVLDGTIEDLSFFAFIAAADQDDDWTCPSVWQKANPSLGITMSAELFAEDCKEAQESPAKENSFRRYRLNQWTEQDIRWLNMAKWDACAAVPRDLDGRYCFAGLDLSSTTDISALVLVFPKDDRYSVLPFFFVPEEGARLRERRDHVPYSQWIRQGYIQATPGEVVDYDVIRQKIKQLEEKYDIREIALDRWNATQLSTQLNGDGFPMIAFGQGYASMNAPTKKLEELVLSGKILHGGNPVLRWMASNVSLEKDAADNWKPSKKKSIERIDGIVAMIMGIDRATTQPEFRSVYETRGFLEIG
jgi:phage terminase large subunit-like protein